MAFGPNEHPDRAVFTIDSTTSSFTYPVLGYGLLTFAVVLTGVTNGNFKFEASIDSTNGTDGTWLDLVSARSNGQQENVTGNLSATPLYSWDASVANYTYVRISRTGGTFGTAVFTLRKFPDASEIMPVVTVQSGNITLSGVSTVVPTAGSRFNHTALATTNAISVKASGGDLLTLCWTNYSASVKYLKLYNKASSPSVGTDIPVLTIPLAATSANVLEFGALGQRFDVGIAFAITGALADTDTTVLVAGDVKVLGTFK